MNELPNPPEQTLNTPQARWRAWYALLLAASMLVLLFLTVGEVQVATWELPDQGPDLGDAPDSTNHHGMTNTAYSVTAPVAGHFPTVWEPDLPSGPKHADVSIVWLGDSASVEIDGEADTGADADVVNNILRYPTGLLDVADQDGNDDGWLNRDVPLPNCKEAVLEVMVSMARGVEITEALYLNVWFDGNHDGDWGDIGTGACDDRDSFEWIVQNRVIDPTHIAPGTSRVFFVPTVLVRNDDPRLPSWIRFTLSERAAPLIPGTNLADGRGPDWNAQRPEPNQYDLGETEDYFVEGATDVEPEITLTKRIIKPNGELTAEWHALPGHEIFYQLILTSTGDVTHTVHISDDLPAGLVAVWAGATSGTAQVVNGGRTVVWDGMLGPTNRPVTIRFKAKLTRRAKCGDELVNRALWRTPFTSGWSNQVLTWLRCHDLGDAPDSSNHSGAGMHAYPTVPGKFPTVYLKDPPEYGPVHHRPQRLHLGRSVSAEYEADVGPDMDGPNNIIPPLDIADRDGGDDGIELDKMNFTHCQVHRFPVRVYVDWGALALLAGTDGMAYINVWLDGDHNGTWADVHQCPQATAPLQVPEHIVIDHPVDVNALGPGLHRIWVQTTGPVYWPAATRAAWLRITLSEQQSDKTAGGGAYGDGRGVDGGFVLGETEDYLLRAPDDLRPDVAIEKNAFLHLQYAQIPTGEWKEVWALRWNIHYGNKGAAPAHNVQIVDVPDVPAGIPMLLDIHAFPPLTPTLSPSGVTFDVGTLLPGQEGYIFVRSLWPSTLPPGTVFTNTVVITSPGEVNPGNNQAVVTSTIPFLRPRIISPRAGTTCTGTVPVVGRVQPFLATPPITVEVFVDGTLHDTVNASNDGRWSSLITGLADGDHEIHAVAHYKGLTSPPSENVKFTVKTSLSWSPISLHFIDQGSGDTIWPRDQYGRMDETGWRVFLRAGKTYTVSVYSCCSGAAQVTLEVGTPLSVTLTDSDGDHWYEASFTAPTPLSDTVRLCVTCAQIQRCSDGQVLIDPEGTVYDMNDSTPVEGASVTCYEDQSSGEGGTYYGLWPADEYGQQNPQTTAGDGRYNFMTPPGTYRVEVIKAGYQRHVSDDLVVVDDPVHYDVYLAPVVTESVDYTITVGALGFDPPVLTVPPGAVIAWINVDGTPHASTSITPTLSGASGVVAQANGDAWNSGLLDSGEVFEHQLNDVGTYTYQDGENGIHAGQILVRNIVYLPIVLKQ